MSFVNAVLRVVVDALLYPFRGMPPIVGLAIVSLATSIGLLLVFKKTSNQKALEAVKRRIHANLFEIRLFNDDLRTILRAQLEILRHNLTYLRHSTVPMLWTLPPLVLLIAQLQFHYGYESLAVGRPALVKVTMGAEASDSAAKPAVRLEASDGGGVEVEEPPVWIPSLREMAWRIEPAKAGDYELRIVNGSETVTKSVRVMDGTDEVRRRSPIRVRGFFDELLYPAEPPLPEGDFESVTVTYPEANLSIFGFELHWMIVYFVLSMAFAFLLRGTFKVTI
ncbi:MAG: hypothetical protein ACRD21_12760 [Vicinamibacteria bacterium]